MTTVLARLSALDGMPNLKKMPAEKDWHFSEKLLNTVLNDHRGFETEYNTLRSVIAYDYCVDAANKCTEAQLTAAFMMAKMQEIIYSTLLDIPAKVEKLQADQAIFRHLLAKRADSDSANVIARYDKKDKKPLFHGLSYTVREKHTFFNQPRLILIRVKSLVVFILEEFKKLQSPLYDPFKTTLSYLSWLFFIPRLATNLILLGKHLIPGSWMHENEKKIDLLKRLWLQMERRGFEISNDLAQAALGLVRCFVLVGQLTPIGLYLSAAVFAYDVVAAMIRSAIEVDRLLQLKKHYQQLIAEKHAKNEPLDDAYLYLDELSKNVSLEIARLELATCSAIFLLLGVFIGLPCFAITPGLSVLSAFLVLAVTVGTYLLNRNLDTQQVSVDLSELLDYELQNDAAFDDFSASF